MIKSRRGATSEVSRQAFVILPIAILILLSLIFLFAKGFGNPLSKATSCESQNGVWSKNGCEITVSSTYSLANSKDHEKEVCCVPISGKEKEFDDWKRTLAATSGATGERQGSETISLEIGGKALSVGGDPLELTANEKQPVLAVKDMEQGDFCVMSVQAGKYVGGSVVVDETGPTFTPKNFDSCKKGTVLDFGEIEFKVFDKDQTRDKKGIYIIKIEVYDKYSGAEFGPFYSYVQAIEPEPEPEADLGKPEAEA
ncbi:hypothetical protein JXA48_01530 [Candidatus Woesearchaeota archaeon]|nr:hypothetical protein [Candidatus Woesearchaeota archaeon]